VNETVVNEIAAIRAEVVDTEINAENVNGARRGEL